MHRPRATPTSRIEGRPNVRSQRLRLGALATALTGCLLSVSACLGTARGVNLDSRGPSAEQARRAPSGLPAVHRVALYAAGPGPHADAHGPRRANETEHVLSKVLYIVSHDMELDPDRMKGTVGRIERCQCDFGMHIGRLGSHADAAIQMRYNTALVVTPSYDRISRLVSRRWIAAVSPDGRMAAPGNAAMILVISTKAAYSTVCFQFDASVRLRRVFAQTYRRRFRGMPGDSFPLMATGDEPCGGEPPPGGWPLPTPPEFFNLQPEPMERHRVMLPDPSSGANISLAH